MRYTVDFFAVEFVFRLSTHGRILYNLDKTAVFFYNERMEEQEQLKQTVANNIAQLRKSKGLTQLELAERLNYSDKAVSKWERGEGLPDVLVLSKMAEIFDVTLAELVDGKTKKPLSPANKKRALIAAAASLLVWVVATIVFVVLRLLPEPPDKAWLAFIYALPATMIVLTVFSVVWKMRLFVFCAVSLLIWTMCLTLFVSIIFVTDNAWLLFIIGIPLQILNIVWFFLLKR